MPSYLEYLKFDIRIKLKARHLPHDNVWPETLLQPSMSQFQTNTGQ